MKKLLLLALLVVFSCEKEEDYENKKMKTYSLTNLNFDGKNLS